MPNSKATPNPMIALDGPSALTLYRDRCDLASQAAKTPQPQNPVEIDSDGDVWLSDEDVAATLSLKSIFGHSDEFEATASHTTQLPSLKRSSMRHFTRCVAKSRDLKLIPYDSLGIHPPAQASPLFILVSDANSKRRVAHVNQRVYTHPIARYSFLRLANSAYLPTPELLYALMAHYLTLPGLLLLAMELCGHYRHVGSSPHRPLSGFRTLYGQRPLTTVARLRDFAGAGEAFSGKKDAIRALKYAADNAASPMETIVYLLLCLPRSLGGYGLKQPILNAKRPVSELAGKITMANHLVPDLYWPEQRLDVEYDSDEFHSDTEALAAGARRTMALRLMQVEVVPLTYDIVCDNGAFDAAAHFIARKLGQRSYPTNDQTAKARKALRDALLYRNGIYKPSLSRMA